MADERRTQPLSNLRWNDGPTEVEVLESDDALQVSTTSRGVTTPVATYRRGQIGSIIDMHSTDTCTLRIRAASGDEVVVRCPPEVCVVLLVKLRKFQGANPEAAWPADVLQAPPETLRPAEPADESRAGSRERASR